MEGMARRSGIQLWWESFGETGEHNAVLHAGAGDTADVFPAEFCEALRESFACVVRFDPRDTGRSTRPAEAYDQVAMAEDLWAVADAAGVASATLIGYSGGGAVVQQAAVAQPARVQGLVLLATGARPPDMQVSDAAIAEMLTPAPGAGPDDPTNFEASDLFFAGGDDDGFRELRARMAPGRAPTARSTEQHFTAILSGPWPNDEQLAAVRAPVLVLHSTDDQVLPHEQADATARPYANALVERVSGIGHVPLLDQWLVLADAIRRWHSS